MKKTENNKIRISLDEARKIRGRSNPAKIIAEQKKEQVKEKKKSC